MNAFRHVKAGKLGIRKWTPRVKGAKGKKVRKEKGKGKGTLEGRK